MYSAQTMTVCARTRIINNMMRLLQAKIFLMHNISNVHTASKQCHICRVLLPVILL